MVDGCFCSAQKAWHSACSSVIPHLAQLRLIACDAFLTLFRRARRNRSSLRRSVSPRRKSGTGARRSQRRRRAAAQVLSEAPWHQPQVHIRLRRKPGDRPAAIYGRGSQQRQHGGVFRVGRLLTARRRPRARGSASATHFTTHCSMKGRRSSGGLSWSPGSVGSSLLGAIRR